MSRIVVPLDGSALAEQALVPATTFAKALDSDVHLIHVGDSAESPGVESYLRGVASRLDDEVGGNVIHAQLKGNVSSTVVDYARSARAQLIVMGTRYHAGIPPAGVSSVALRVVRRAAVPVLLTGSETTPVRRNEEWECRRILIPLDGSEAARLIVDPVAGMAVALRARITLLRVIPLVPAELRYSSVPLGAPLEPLVHVHEASLQLEEAARALRRRGIGTDTRVVQTVMSTANAIVNEAIDAGADLVALATRGHGLARRVAFGSVAQELVRYAQWPMLVLSAGKAAAITRRRPTSSELVAHDATA